MKSPVRFLTLAVAAALLAAPIVSAADAARIDFPQISPKGTVEQRIGLTDVKIEYFRPSVRGRKVFGHAENFVLQPYGEIWRVGANNPTKISFSRPVRVGGVEVPEGSYGLYAIPGEQEWTVILNRVGGSDWGAYAYKQQNDVLRYAVKPQKLTDMVETFTIDLGNLNHESATLDFAWEKTRISVPLVFDLSDLKQQIATAMATAPTKPYMQAAMFNYESDGDLKAALAWMDEGLKANPKAFWMTYRRGLILEKMGDKVGAKAQAEASKAMAESATDQPPLLRNEYVRLNNALIARLK